MNTDRKLSDNESWLAAEYALGVLGRDDMQKAGKLCETDRAFRAAVEGWQSQLEPLLDEVDEVAPPPKVWTRIQGVVSPAEIKVARETGNGFWKLLTAFSSTVAVGCFALLMYSTGGDFTGSQRTSLTEQLAAAQAKVETAQTQLAELASADDANRQALSESRDALASAEAEMEALQSELQLSRTELASVMEQIDGAQPLVASLTQTGDEPAFVAQYDPLRKALLIRTSVADADDKVPEIWLIPDQGDRKGEVLSLGVMDENAPDVVQITEEFLPLIGEGGTLAITMEPPGGAPNGVATGPVIALGKLQAL